MYLHLQIIGLLLVALAFSHAIFSKYFNWKKDLSSLSLINRQMMTIHTFFIALMVLLMGILCLSYPTDLIETRLGKIICFGFGIFWAVRLLVQFFWYSSTLWKGKKFETIVHVLFSLLWVYLSTVFFIIHAN